LRQSDDDDVDDGEGGARTRSSNSNSNSSKLSTASSQPAHEIWPGREIRVAIGSKVP